MLAFNQCNLSRVVNQYMINNNNEYDDDDGFYGEAYFHSFTVELW